MPTPGRPGRPRDPRAHRAVLEAAIHLLGERGVTAMSVDAVAARARVSKATIYRRWASKEALCVEAVACVVVNPPPPGETDPRRAVTALLTGIAAALESSDAGRLLPHLASAAASDPQLADIWRQSLVEPARRRVTALVRRAAEAGDLAPDTDVELVGELLLAPLFYRRLVTGRRATPTDVERLVAAVWQPCAGP